MAEPDEFVPDEVTLTLKFPPGRGEAAMRAFVRRHLSITDPAVDPNQATADWIQAQARVQDLNEIRDAAAAPVADAYQEMEAKQS